MRHKAIAAGVILPPSYAERQEAKKKNSTLKSYFNGPTFTVDLLNMILVIWLVRHALPWARFEDPSLRAAFYTINRGAVICSRTWAAQQSVLLYSDLHSKALSAVRVSHFCFLSIP